MNNLIKSAKSKIPTIDHILEETWENLKINEIINQDRFSKILVDIDLEATRIFKEYEKQALIELTKKWLESQQATIREQLEKVLSQSEWEDFINSASKIFKEFGFLVQDFEKILGNMRKSRGGKNFERAIIKLLNLMEIKVEAPSGKAKKQLRRIDIVSPSVETAISTPDRAIFLTCKQTLRERWKQEVPQVGINQRVYLLTIDEKLPMEKANEIHEKNLIAFVRDELKQVEHIKDKPWIRKLSDLPMDLRRL